MKRVIAVLIIVLLASIALALEVKQGTQPVITWFHSDGTNHLDYKTSLSPTVKVSKGGGAWSTSANSAAEVGYGRYKITLSSGETDTLGDLCIHAEASGADYAQRCVDVVANVESDSVSAIGALPTPPTAASVSDAMWDEASADHVAAGSMGQLMSAMATATDPWLASLPGAYEAGTAGYIIGHPDSWGRLVLPAIQGQAYTAVAAQSREVTIVRGDTPRIPFDLGADYAGWAAKFGAKSKPEDAAFVIAVKDATWTDASHGQGYVDLTAAETATSGRLYAEIELRSGASRLTAIRFVIKIIEDVIR